MPHVTLPLVQHSVAKGMHAAAAARGRRRLLQQQTSTISQRLAGDIAASGYFSVSISVGTPPQHFSLIVDTGSSITALPCDACKECLGQHANPRFQPADSHTFWRIGCEQSEEYGCSSCMDGACAYHVAYQEGSSYSGYLATDMVRLGGGNGGCGTTLRFAFGCATREYGHFRSQQADGIMGLASSRTTVSRSARNGKVARRQLRSKRRLPDAPKAAAGGAADRGGAGGGGSSPTVLEALVERGLVEDSFSLCIGRGGGSLSFGVPPPHRAPIAAEAARANGPPPPPPARSSPRDETLWAHMDNGAYYSIAVGGTRYGARALGAAPSSTIIDSGTTFMYMHSSAFRPLLAALRATACGGVTLAAAPQDEFCVRVPYDDDGNDNDGGGGGGGGGVDEVAPRALDSCFAAVHVELSGGGTLSLAPSQYFYRSDAPREWCVGIFDNYEDGLVLGTINLFNRLVTFDRGNSRVGFRSMDCAAYEPDGGGGDGGGNHTLVPPGERHARRHPAERCDDDAGDVLGAQLEGTRSSALLSPLLHDGEPPRVTRLLTAANALSGHGQGWLPVLPAPFRSSLSVGALIVALAPLLAVAVFAAARYTWRRERPSATRRTPQQSMRRPPTAEFLRSGSACSEDDDEEDTRSVAGSDHCLLGEADRDQHFIQFQQRL